MHKSYALGEGLQCSKCPSQAPPPQRLRRGGKGTLNFLHSLPFIQLVNAQWGQRSIVLQSISYAKYLYWRQFTALLVQWPLYSTLSSFNGLSFYIPNSMREAKNISKSMCKPLQPSFWSLSAHFIDYVNKSVDPCNHFLGIF